MKLNFSLLKLNAIDGRELDIKIHQSFANAIYSFTKDLGLLEVAKKIYAGEEVEVRDSDINEFNRLISDERVGFLAFVQDALKKFINKKE
jgi:hypothetical protein